MRLNVQEKMLVKAHSSDKVCAVRTLQGTTAVDVLQQEPKKKKKKKKEDRKNITAYHFYLEFTHIVQRNKGNTIITG